VPNVERQGKRRIHEGWFGKGLDLVKGTNLKHRAAQGLKHLALKPGNHKGRRGWRAVGFRRFDAATGRAGARVAAWPANHIGRRRLQEACGDTLHPRQHQTEQDGQCRFHSETLLLLLRRWSVIPGSVHGELNPRWTHYARSPFILPGSETARKPGFGHTRPPLSQSPQTIGWLRPSGGSSGWESRGWLVEIRLDVRPGLVNAP
jgi:hypothetical protein